ncbi:MAG: transporter permease [Nevskia sp.]|nr:transporter permease [Nevskia sp.]
MSLSLARATLIHEWPRFLPGVLSVAFAGVLMLVQLGLLLGMFGTVSVLIDRSDAQIWITSPETASFDESRDIPVGLGALIRSQPGIQDSDAMRTYDAEWRLEQGIRVGVVLVGIEPSSSAPSCPAPMRTTLCARLAEPMAVVVDQAELDKLGASLGALAEINGHRVRVVGISRGLRAIGATFVFASPQTLREIGEAPLPGVDSATFVLARLQPGADAQQVRDQLQALLHANAYRVWTQDEFSAGTQRYWLTESGVGAGFLFSSLLGLIIGVVITSQTLRAVILASLREYATFRAIGVPSSRLGAVVLEQSLWIGVAGAALTLLLSALIVALAHAFYVPLTLTWWAVLAAVVIGIVTAGLSGLLALRALYQLEPAVLLR